MPSLNNNWDDCKPEKVTLFLSTRKYLVPGLTFLHFLLYKRQIVRSEFSEFFDFTFYFHYWFLIAVLKYVCIYDYSFVKMLDVNYSIFIVGAVQWIIVSILLSALGVGSRRRHVDRMTSVKSRRVIRRWLHVAVLPSHCSRLLDSRPVAVSVSKVNSV